jgi:sugar phosphate isomerase/epimerase
MARPFAPRNTGIPFAARAALAVTVAMLAPPRLAAANDAFTPVLHSVSYAGVWRDQTRLDVDAFLLKAKELGFAHVELVGKRPHVSPLDYDASARQRLRARIKELGLTLACLAAYPDFTAGADKPGIPAAEIGAVYVGEAARLAKDLGTSCVRVFTGYERPGVPFDVQWGIVVQGLKLASKEAARHGVTLAVQNHHDIAVAPDALLWLIKEVAEPNCKAAFDAWSPALAGINGAELEAAAKKLAPHMAYTTVADYVKQPRLRYDATLTNYVRGDDVVRAVPFGTGFIDYKAFFRGLRAGGYKGYVAYEMCEVLDGGGSLENLDKTARSFLKTFREMTAQTNTTR